uniref:Delta glutathione S-transferase n=1 Tax=Locusta migratoria TaxID=7004 RepID=V9Q328_LOCMI|nr:delta glutathione S-transferase [Locusta migratoria]
MAGLKLYSVSDSPPSTAVKMALEALALEYTNVEVDFAAGEHLSDDFSKKNPQREIPCLDDNGFFLSESVAILQYLADKYGPGHSLYPRDPQQRALVNHRLAFNISTYYARIAEYAVAPIFFDYKRTPEGLNKLKIALNVLNTILERQGTKFAAGEHMTLADLSLVAATMCLEAVEFDLTPWARVQRWYADFKQAAPRLWAVAEPAMLELRAFSNSPPDLSALRHPYHPVRASK